MPLDSIRALWEARELPSDALATLGGSEHWRPLSDALGVVSVPPAPPSLPAPVPAQNQNPLNASPMFTIMGHGVRMEVFADRVELAHSKRSSADLSLRQFMGTKTLPFRSIAAVRFRAGVGGGWMKARPGALWFSDAGGHFFSVITNTFTFDAKDNDVVTQAKCYIERRMNELHSSEKTATAIAALSLSDELKKLAELRASGALSESEFDAAKKRLLA